MISQQGNISINPNQYGDPHPYYTPWLPYYNPYYNQPYPLYYPVYFPVPQPMDLAERLDRIEKKIDGLKTRKR